MTQEKIQELRQELYELISGFAQKHDMNPAYLAYILSHEVFSLMDWMLFGSAKAKEEQDRVK